MQEGAIPPGAPSARFGSDPAPNLRLPRCPAGLRLRVSIPRRITMHSIRFPNETPGYRQARNQLLEAERDLRRNVEQVAAMRRQLPLGGEVREDYVFHEFSGPGDPVRPVRLSELFDPAKNTLALYSFMYGPDEARPCPLCTSILDS